MCSEIADEDLITGKSDSSRDRLGTDDTGHG